MKNLRTMLLPAGICFLFLTSVAQPRPGLKGGLNIAGLSGYHGNKLLSFHTGVFVHLIINENWRIQPELLYSGEGQHYPVYDNENPVGNTNTLELRYIQLPLVIQYFPIASLYVEGGPQLALLTGAYSKGSGQDHLNLKRSFRNTQFGLNLGTGFFFNQQTGIYGRYYFGLTDVTPYNSDINRSHTIQLGILFRVNVNRNAAINLGKPGSGSNSR